MCAAIPDHLLQEIAGCAGVPVGQRQFFFETIRTVMDTVRDREALRASLKPKRGKKLADAACAVYETLGNLNDGERSQLESILSKGGSIFSKISHEGFVGLNVTVYQLALLLCIATGRASPRFPHQIAQPLAGGRRTGAVKNWLFQNFVSDLLIAAATAGGNLSLEKNSGAGSLVRVIKLLTPHLPPGVAPSPLSTSTLQRIKRHVGEINTAVNDLS